MKKFLVVKTKLKKQIEVNIFYNEEKIACFEGDNICQRDKRVKTFFVMFLLNRTHNFLKFEWIKFVQDKLTLAIEGIYMIGGQRDQENSIIHNIKNPLNCI